MLFDWLMIFVHTQMQILNANAFDLRLDTNNQILMYMSYMGSANHFFPVIDAYLPIMGLYIIVYGFFGGVKFLEVCLNLLRGSGVRI